MSQRKFRVERILRAERVKTKGKTLKWKFFVKWSGDPWIVSWEDKDLLDFKEDLSILEEFWKSSGWNPDESAISSPGSLVIPSQHYLEGKKPTKTVPVDEISSEEEPPKKKARTKPAQASSSKTHDSDIVMIDPPVFTKTSTMNSTTRGPYSNPANGTTHKTQDSIRTAQSRPEGSLGLVDLSQKIFEEYTAMDLDRPAGDITLTPPTLDLTMDDFINPEAFEEPLPDYEDEDDPILRSNGDQNNPQIPSHNNVDSPVPGFVYKENRMTPHCVGTDDEDLYDPVVPPRASPRITQRNVNPHPPDTNSVHTPNTGIPSILTPPPSVSSLDSPLRQVTANSPPRHSHIPLSPATPVTGISRTMASTRISQPTPTVPATTQSLSNSSLISTISPGAPGFTLCLSDKILIPLLIKDYDRSFFEDIRPSMVFTSHGPYKHSEVEPLIPNWLGLSGMDVRRLIKLSPAKNVTAEQKNQLVNLEQDLFNGKRCILAFVPDSPTQDGLIIFSSMNKEFGKRLAPPPRLRWKGVTLAYRISGMELPV